MKTAQSQLQSARLTCIVLLLFIALLPLPAAAQEISAVKAMRLFDNENYPEAETIFLALLREDTKNPMLNYYYGASRTENGNFSDSDLEYLLQAGKNITPDRLHYYLGIQYHARNNWEEAIRYYNLFRLSVPETELQKLELPKKIQQCYDHVNPYESLIQQQKAENIEESVPQANIQISEPELWETEVSAVPEQEAKIVAGDTFNNVSDSVLIFPGQNDDFSFDEKPEDLHSSDGLQVEQTGLPELPGLPEEGRKTVLPPGDPIEFRINENITYLFDSQFRTEEGKELFEKGTFLKRTLNEKIDELDQSRKAYRNTNAPDEKKALAEKIVSLETDTYTIQDSVNALFASARSRESEYWGNASETESYNFNLEQEKIIAIIESEKEETRLESQEQYISMENIPESFFEIYEQKSAAQDSKKNDQLIYKIQIGAYSRGVPAHRQRLFNKLSLIRKIENYTDEKGVVVYTTGNLTNLEDAEKMRNQIKQDGVQDAIVAPYFNEKRIPLEQAKQIEAGK